MARKILRLKAKGLDRLPKGLYPDGQGLHLYVGPTGARSWTFRFSSPTIKQVAAPTRGRAREAGLGPFPDVGLTEARELAADMRRLIRAGIDPIEEKHAKRRAAVTAISFREAAEAYIAAHSAEWSNARHRAQWSQTLETYAFPTIGDMPVDRIETAHVVRTLEPLWSRARETASRLRGRIESVLDWSATRGYRSGENPARWRGHLDHLLPRRSREHRPTPHPAMAYRDLPAFVCELRAIDRVEARALEFLILTAARSGEVLGATWSEIDLTAKVWTVPGSRMKSGREHRVPLSDRAVQIIAEVERHGDHLFADLLGKINHSQIYDLVRGRGSVHGFRSSFRDWAAERTNFPREVCEQALAHAIGNQVERAYLRSDLIDQRRRLMAAWAAFLDRPQVEEGGGEVIDLGERRA